MHRRDLLRLAPGLLGLLAGCQGEKNRVTLYCAQDREFAESLLAEYSARNNISVLPKFDTEADKSVSLYEELVREKDRPRCDVHWNNEILATIRLQRLGILEPYQSPAAQSYPDWAKANDSTWTAFAARARVLIVNTRLVAEADRPRSILELTQPKWRGRVAMAKPLFGTTATHAAALFEVLGSEPARRFFSDLAANGVQIVSGNKQSALAVARGDAWIGLTDTDDAIIEVEAGRPVSIIFPDRDPHPEYPRLGPLFIPNTLALIKGAPNRDAGRKLIDYLLSPQIEARLAANASRQIPINPTVEANLPAAIVRPRDTRPMAVDFSLAADLWEQSQTFLRQLFARG